MLKVQLLILEVKTEKVPGGVLLDRPEEHVIVTMHDQNGQAQADIIPLAEGSLAISLTATGCFFWLLPRPDVAHFG